MLAQRIESEGAQQLPWIQVISHYTVQAVEGAIPKLAPRHVRMLASYWEVSVDLSLPATKLLRLHDCTTA